jgi:hypothetical protein
MTISTILRKVIGKKYSRFRIIFTWKWDFLEKTQFCTSLHEKKSDTCRNSRLTKYVKSLKQLSEVDWDQKASATIHTKNFIRPPKFLQKTPFLKFCMGNCKSPCDQCRIATMACPPLATLYFEKLSANWMMVY